MMLHYHHWWAGGHPLNNGEGGPAARDNIFAVGLAGRQCAQIAASKRHYHWLPYQSVIMQCEKAALSVLSDNAALSLFSVRRKFRRL